MCYILITAKHYFHPIFICSLRIKGIKIEFIHTSFKDYLLAEYYIESILENKIYKLNIGTPSEESILFVSGLVDLLNSKDSHIEAFITDIGLLNSFNSNKKLDVLQELTNTTIKAIEDESIVLLNDRDHQTFSQNLR